MNRRTFMRRAGLGTSLFLSGLYTCTGRKPRPNILWIVAEDMSAHFSCYGEKTIETPNIDTLASQGAKYNNVFVTCPVCSPCRSALISGMYQTKLGAHLHRSQRDFGKGGGDPVYRDSYRVPVKLLPQLFQEAGYYTVLGRLRAQNTAEQPAPPLQNPVSTAEDSTDTQGRAVDADPQQKPVSKNLGKSDYNFIWNEDIYDADDWEGRGPGQPFFAQIQLAGGKARNSPIEKPVDPARITLPPYYADHPVIRQDWADYLKTVLLLDQEVGVIMQRLKDEGVEENTAVFLFTDHGISHLRGKQFLYDEGIRVPMILRWPGEIKPGSVQEQLISLIDVSVTSLHMAGIGIPDYMDGRNFLTARGREFIAAARDRCDETVDCIRCIRTKRFKYIRNYCSHRSHMQPNQYKDGKKITQTSRALYAEGRLDSLQASLFAPSRPPEELYDLQNDPFEIDNLVGSPGFQGTLEKLRALHARWMRETLDMGLIPEPVLEEMGRTYGNKYFVLRQKETKDLVQRCWEVIELGEQGAGALDDLAERVKDPSAAIRYRAAYAIGHLGDSGLSAVPVLMEKLRDESGAVRIAAARALCLMGKEEDGLPVLLTELKSNPNHVVRHFAALFFEDLGEKARPFLEDFILAEEDSYEYVFRVARRLVNRFSETA